MVQAIRANNPDLMGAQEINDHAFEVIGHLGTDYQVSSLTIISIKISQKNVLCHSFWSKGSKAQVAGSSSAGHAIIYRESALTFESYSFAELNEQV